MHVYDQFNHDEDDKKRKSSKGDKAKRRRATIYGPKKYTITTPDTMQVLKGIVDQLRIDDVDLDFVKAMSRADTRTGCNDRYTSVLAYIRHNHSNFGWGIRQLGKHEMHNYSIVLKLAVIDLCAEKWPQLEYAARLTSYKSLAEQQELGNTIALSIREVIDREKKRLNWRIWEYME